MNIDGRWQMEIPFPAPADTSPFVAFAGVLGRAAGAHASHLGLSLDALAKLNLTWMLSRFLVRMTRTPAPGEPLMVTTWPSGVARFLALRDFLVRDHQGVEVARGTSAWFLIDLGGRRPVKPDPHIGHLCVHERVIDSLERIDEVVPSEWQQTFDVRPADIDRNQHVTFSSYIRWVEAALRETGLASGAVLSLEINYLAEVFLGDTVRVEGGFHPLADGRLLAGVTRTSDGAPVAKAAVHFGDW